MFQRCLVTYQRLSRPVAADQVEAAVLNRIPFRGSGRIVSHCNRQAEFIGELLQICFPRPAAAPAGAATVSFDQQVVLPGVSQTPDLTPPPTNYSDSEFRCVVRSADHDEALIAPDIVNPIRDRDADGITTEVVVQYIVRRASPLPTGLLETTNHLFLFGIYADHRPLLLQKRRTQFGQVAKLFITPGHLLSRQFLAVDTHGVVTITQQSRYSRRTDRMAFSCQ